MSRDMRHTHRCHAPRGAPNRATARWGPQMRPTQYPPAWESGAESYGPGLLGRPDTGSPSRLRDGAPRPGDDMLPDGSGLPGERHLVERLVAESLGGARNRAAAERAIELDGRIVVGQRPNHQAAQAALGEIAPGRGEQPAAEAQALEFRPQIEFIDLAVVGEAARAVAAVIGVAGDALGEHQQRDAAALADGGLPPGRAAPADQLLELRTGDDAAICRAPSLIVGLRDGHGVGSLRPANLDEGGSHDPIEAKRAGLIQVLC